LANLHTLTETELVHGLLSHSPGAFSAIYDNYAPALLGIIFTIVKERAQAEQLLEDSFIKIRENTHLYNPKKVRLFTWLVSICRKTAIDHLHGLKKKPFLEIQTGETGVYRAETNTIGDNGGKKPVFNLPPMYRDVLQLVYFFGYTQEQASEILYLPLATVKTRTCTAVQLLRKQCGMIKSQQ
jgi:RNA polymerase sigma-70 factor (ECF subfamily)